MEEESPTSCGNQTHDIIFKRWFHLHCATTDALQGSLVAQLGTVVQLDLGAECLERGLFLDERLNVREGFQSFCFQRDLLVSGWRASLRFVPFCFSGGISSRLLWRQQPNVNKFIFSCCENAQNLSFSIAPLNHDRNFSGVDVVVIRGRHNRL